MIGMPTARVRRGLVIGGLVLGAMFALGARCIENESVYVDSDGYTHIVGNMANETDVSASTVTLSATLFDANGNVLSTTTGLLCPMSVQPHSQTAFELRFPEPNLPAYSRYEVRPISGTTIDAALPASLLAFEDLAAYRVRNTLAVAGAIRNDNNVAFTEVMYCAAAYDDAGRMIKMQWSPLPGTPLSPGQSLRLPIVWPDLPAAATEIVVWVAVGPTAQWVMSDRVRIQNSDPPR